MVLELRIYGDSILKRSSLPVTKIDKEIKSLAANMAETMYLNKGVGLAAPQIGVSKRIIIIDISKEYNSLITLINPEVIYKEGEEVAEEGCLSLPGISAEVVRPSKVVIKGLDLKGKVVEVVGEGLASRAFLHEIDHLNGILFIDRINKEKRRELRKELKELKRLAKKGIR